MESALTNATSQTNFGTIDWVIVAVYLLLSVSIAFFVKRYAGNMTNFVSAGRAVGTWLGVATLTGTEMGLITVMYSAQKGFTSGFAMANVDSVDITVRGVGGHGSQPQSAKDTIVLAAQIVLALQTIVSREIHPLEPAVVTVGSIHGGTKHNIIPDEVHLQLTLRSYSDEVRAKLIAAIRRIVKGQAIAAGLPEASVTDPREVDRIGPTCA